MNEIEIDTVWVFPGSIFLEVILGTSDRRASE